MKQLKEFPKYSVTEDGRVWSSISNKFLSPGISQGYKVVNLCLPPTHPDFKYKKYKMCRVHRLVAETFLENPNNYPCINHIDGNKQNNNISNLEWCTYAYNNAHAVEHGLRHNKPRKIKDLKEILKDFLTGNYTVKALEEKYDWYTSAGFTRKYLHEYAKQVGKEDEYLQVKATLKRKAAALGTEALKREVVAYTPEGVFLRKFSSLKEAALFYKVQINSVCKCCKRNIEKTRKNVTFRYSNEPFDWAHEIVVPNHCSREELLSLVDGFLDKQM